MSDIAIRCEGLSKQYRIGKRERYRALRDVLTDSLSAPFRLIANSFRDSHKSPISNLESCLTSDLQPLTSDSFWALDDVSFEIKHGEVVGIIGRNGAGKSTLLKILSRITEPTRGFAEINGRVGSLLEVGTGFHPELTGRENIYLNGAILGMKRAEIERRFDEIVAFAETEKFLDTPVKYYSSGMQMRLAFAVAAHLDPEILLIDEVLAVGDAAFQKKCLGKMSDVAREGRTVLFVSHNMAAVNRICERCILLESGLIKADADTHTITAQYMVSDTGTMAERQWLDERLRPGDDFARLIAVRVLQGGEVADTMDIRHSVEVEMTYSNEADAAQLIASFAFFDSYGVHLFATADFGDQQSARPRPPGIYRSACRVPGNLFAEGIVRVTAEVSTRHPVYQIHFLVHDSVGFQVVDTAEPGSVRSGWGRAIPGVMRPMCEWSTWPDEGAQIADKPLQAEMIVAD
jgi:lipopolysaccharide transport system ATP-binding protein